MKTKLAALASALVLTLLMSTLWGKGPDLGVFLPSADPSADPPGWGVPAEPADGLGGVVLGACPIGSTPFTGQFSSLMKGEINTNPEPYSVPGSTPEVPGPFEVDVTITVHSDNTFRFDVTGGFIHRILVKAGLGTVVYDYDGSGGPNPDYDPLMDPLSEEFLNKVSFDEGLNKRAKRSQAVSHLDFCLSAIEVPPNTNFFGSCLEGEDGINEGDFDGDGCNPSGFQNVLLPQAISGSGFENETVMQAAVPARTYSDPYGLCVGEFIALDPRVNPLDPSTVMTHQEQDLNELFHITPGLDLDPAFTGAVLPMDIVGSPCLALIHGENSLEFNGLTGIDWRLTETGPTLTVTQIPETIPGMFDGLGRITAPLCEDGEFPAPTAPPAPALPGITCTLDLQFVEEATHQPDIRTLPNYPEQLAGAFTNEVFNGSRTKTSRGTFHIQNTRQACLDVTPDPSFGKPYFAAVQECKKDFAVAYFENLRLALIVSEGALIDENITFLFTPFNKARSQFNNGHYRKAINDLNQLRDRVLSSQWDVLVQNDPGGLIVRIDNALLRAMQLQQAEDRHGL
jgi:hypothetical protein